MPIDDIMAAYNCCQQRDFGENYVNELVGKSRTLPADIRWHFIGHLQANKAKILASIPNLSVVETVDSVKIAASLEKAMRNFPERPPLSVFIQINTSGEQSTFRINIIVFKILLIYYIIGKSGIDPTKCIELAEYICSECPRLKLTGLMTIGEAISPSPGADNPDFKRLIECKYMLVQAGYSKDLELSMGMSGDFLEAIRLGSTNVRVGSAIFGSRP
jgi:uncharacterized pyridoxal phosphate-containing UPF0001 family protein